MVQDIYNDPEFKALSNEDRFKVLNEVDPEFKALPQDQKEQVIIGLSDNQQQSQTEQQPIQGKVEENVFADTAKGLLSGLSTIPRAAGQLSNKFLRPAIGKKPLQPNELNNALAFVGANNYEPQSLAGNIAKFAGDALPYFAMPELKLAQGFKGANLLNKVGTGAYQGGAIGLTENLAKGDFNNTGFDTAISAGLGAALPLGIRAYGKIAGKIADPLAGIPETYFNRAFDQELAGKSIFKGKFDKINSADEIQNKLKQGYDIAQNKTGELVNKQEQLLKEGLTPVDVSGIKQGLDDYIQSKTGYKSSGFNKADLNDLNYLQDKLSSYNKSGGAYPIDLHFDKLNLQDILYKNGIKPSLSTRGSNALFQAENDINQALRTDYPEYGIANDQYSTLMDLAKKLKPFLNEDTGAAKIVNANTEANQIRKIPQALQGLEKLIPEENQFYADLQDLTAREPFEFFQPARGYTTGGYQGIGNNTRNMIRGILGTAGVGGSYFTNGSSLAPYLLSELLFSPQTAKKTIQGLGLINKIPTQAAPIIYSQSQK